MSVLTEKNNTNFIKQYVRILSGKDSLSRVALQTVFNQQASSKDYYEKKTRVTKSRSIISGKINSIQLLWFLYLATNNVITKNVLNVKKLVVEKIEMSENLYSLTNTNIEVHILTKKSSCIF